MFYTLILENETGQQVDLSKTANRYMFSKIKGLAPPTGTISTSNYAGMNGSYLNNAFIEKRNVVISFEMRGVYVELRRHELYCVVKPSRYIKIYYFTKNYAYVLGKGKGEKRKRTIYFEGTEPFSLDRYEVYVDAKDISDEEQENGETKPLSEEEYAELLKEKGKQSIVPITMKSESQIAVQSTQFQYGVDYFVGDFVTVEHHRFGIRQNKIQLVGMIESFDRNGRNLTPTFKEA